MIDDPTAESPGPQLESLRPAPSASDTLRSIYRHPGPYTSVYLQTRPLQHDPPADLERRWSYLRPALADQRAPAPALDAVAARLALPTPADTAGVGVIAAADGHTLVDHALEPPRFDFTHVDNLPYVAPLLEWDQHRVPHLVVTLDRGGADVVVFGIEHRTPVTTTRLIGNPVDLAADLSARVRSVDAQLVVVAGEVGQGRGLADALTRSVDPGCRVVVDDEHVHPDDLADATVRYVIDTAARTTVGYLQVFRFLASHEAAVDGTDATIEALAAGTPDVLLIHDDPDDDRRVWIGDDPRMLSIVRRPGIEINARFIDAAIRSAVIQGIDVHVIPSTGPGGPADDTAALDHDGGVRVPSAGQDDP